eukprot:CAMPEP_0118930650 /NCGR_PEP_ID=MMETSP1169-20130426/7264_1 /TAXON_ID=36882 /ORGANISM="Pyramimonas obovata, Strain CCMP722" /LENGTH=67 /DNA_ID=CAMNT_0006873035 /DNA_START=139 /DNA_END=339 /DNA_ORIENTATION=+
MTRSTSTCAQVHNRGITDSARLGEGANNHYRQHRDYKSADDVGWQQSSTQRRLSTWVSTSTLTSMKV